MFIVAPFLCPAWPAPEAHLARPPAGRVAQRPQALHLAALRPAWPPGPEAHLVRPPGRAGLPPPAPRLARARPPECSTGGPFEA